MINWKNFDTLASYGKLQSLKGKVCLQEAMAGEAGAARVAKYSAPMAGGLTFNYATREVDDEVIAALRLLTHADGVPYLDYVREIANNPVAKKVKLADLAHNSDLSRLDHEPTETDLARVEKYRKAREILLQKG